jgi:hypothetical protein
VSTRGNHAAFMTRDRRLLTVGVHGYPDSDDLETMRLVYGDEFNDDDDHCVPLPRVLSTPREVHLA